MTTNYRPFIIHDIELSMNNYDIKASKNSTLMITIHTNSQQAIDDLWSNKISIEEIDHQNDAGWTVLHYLSQNADKIAEADVILQGLLWKGANINLPTKTGLTPLMIAVKNTSIDIVKVLAKNSGVNINAQEYTEKASALMLAVNDASILKLLLEHSNIDPNSKDVNGDTALIGAILESQVEICQLLLNHPKIDINQLDVDGLTPLMIAIKYRGDSDDIASSNEIVKLMLKDDKSTTEANKININHQDKTGKTALMYAMKNANEVNVWLLGTHLTMKDEINLQDEDGNTALMHAIIHSKGKSSIQMVMYLLSHTYIDVNRVNKKGMTALIMACKLSRKKIVQLLMDRNDTDINIRSVSQKTALMASNKKILKLLLSYDNISYRIILKYDHKYMAKMPKKQRKILMEYIDQDISIDT